MISKVSGPSTASAPPQTAPASAPTSRIGWLAAGLILLPVLALGLALFIFLNSPIRLVQPEASGPTPALRAIGQNFLSEHKGLKAVKVRLPDQDLPENLRLHLREPNSTLDLRTASPATLESRENWLRFDFAPLEANYQSRPLVFELEAAKPFQVLAAGEVYREGQSFYEGAAQSGDLTFELEYAPDATALLKVYFTRQAAYNGSALLGLGALIGWLLLAVAGCGGLIWKRANFSPESIRQMSLGRFAGLSLYFLAMAACGGLAFVFLTPPLQGLDEQGHAGRIIFAYNYQSNPASYPQLYEDAYQLETQARYIEYIPGFDFNNSPLATSILSPLSETYQPPVYYAIAGGLVRLASFLTGNSSFLFQLYVCRLAGLLLGLGGLAIALLWVYYLRREFPRLFMLIPALYALFPAYLFISGMTNNDNGVNFFVPLVILCVTILYKEASYKTASYKESLYRSSSKEKAGSGQNFWRRNWPVILILLGSTFLAYQSKHTSGVFLAILLLFTIYDLRFTLKLPKFSTTKDAKEVSNNKYQVSKNSKLETRNFLTDNRQPTTDNPSSIVNRQSSILILVLLVISIILFIKTPWQLQAIVNFGLNTKGTERLFPSLQSLLYTYESFWCSLGWVNFSDVLGGRLLLIFFLLTILALFGNLRLAFGYVNLKLGFSKNLSSQSSVLNRLALAGGGHILFLVLYRIVTTYGRGDGVIEFPQGRFFLLALIPLGLLVVNGLGAIFPRRVRENTPLWLVNYLWLFGLLIYALITVFGGFLPFYYNQN